MHSFHFKLTASVPQNHKYDQFHEAATFDTQLIPANTTKQDNIAKLGFTLPQQLKLIEVDADPHDLIKLINAGVSLKHITEVASGLLPEEFNVAKILQHLETAYTPAETMSILKNNIADVDNYFYKLQSFGLDRIEISYVLIKYPTIIKDIMALLRMSLSLHQIDTIMKYNPEMENLIKLVGIMSLQDIIFFFKYDPNINLRRVYNLKMQRLQTAEIYETIGREKLKKMKIMNRNVSDDRYVVRIDPYQD